MKKLSMAIIVGILSPILINCSKKEESIKKTEEPKEISFKEYWASSGYDKNKNGAIDPDEVVGIENLNVSGKGLKDLDGIEKFIDLNILDASNNKITSVTFSNPVLRDLNISNNKLTKLDISQCIHISGGHGKLDATKNENLTCIRLNGSNQITSPRNFPDNWKKDAKAEFNTKCN